MNRAQRLDAKPLTPSASLSKADIFSLAKSERKGVPYTVNYIRFSAKGGIAIQSHEDEHFIYCKSGRIAITVDGEESILDAGMCLNIPPLAPHGFRNTEPGVTEILILKI